MNLKKKWINHLQQNNMTYFEHMIFAMTYGVIAIFAGCLLIVHSILPCFFQYSGSSLVKKLNKGFSNDK